MWEVVGFRMRAAEKCTYYDLYLQREAREPGVGVEVFVTNYSTSRVAYVPRIGDRVMVSLDVYNGRKYATDVVPVD